jgi:polyvinyl alcohol dehydrogenase (cytochrome)
MGGYDYRNTRSNPAERIISPSTARNLAVGWTATTHGDVSATPAVVDGAIYFPDWGGFFSKVDAKSGRVIWSHAVAEYSGVAGAVSRTSPAVSGGVAYIGDQNGAHLLAVDTRTGNLRWRTQLDSHPAAILTQSPIVVDGMVYQGVSSVEEGFAVDPTYPCCTFRGSLNAVNASTGRLLWKTYTVPDNGGQPGGYSGGAVWGSTPAVDSAHRTVYVTTGNNYTVPQSVKDCQQAGNPPTACLDPDDHIDSILALDTRSGRIKWATGAGRFDDWNGSCIPGLPPNNCPENPGEDFDFGDGAHLFSIRDSHGRSRQIVGAGQKSGEYWAVDAGTGEVVWSAAPGPGSALGGIQWGTATDGKRIYLAEANFFGLPYTLPDGQTITYGSFAALDPATGRLLWHVPDPRGGADLAALSTANGVVFAGSLNGWMYALDGRTGNVVWEYRGEGASNAGPAIANGTVYWGNGYSRADPTAGSTTFYAFRLGQD